MGVDDAERSRLVLQIGEHAHQHDVLDDIGKAAGMKGVTVVHGETYGRLEKARPSSTRHGRACPGHPRAFRNNTKERRRGCPGSQTSLRSLRKADCYARA